MWLKTVVTQEQLLAEQMVVMELEEMILELEVIQTVAMSVLLTLQLVPTR